MEHEPKSTSDFRRKDDLMWTDGKCKSHAADRIRLSFRDAFGDSGESGRRFVVRSDPWFLGGSRVTAASPRVLGSCALADLAGL